jgi:fructose-1,6-bisphosphatase/inositol monophosphatase family enzyme
VETEAILTLLQDVADRVINPRFRSLTEDQVEEKNPGDLVTVADHEAEALITEALLAAYPGAVVLGEEAFAADAGLLQKYAAADHAFTVDPVDGTKNFVHGSKDHAVMVAELRDGAVTRSWIWQPQHELAYVAERDLGATVNGRPLHRPAPSATQREWRGVTSRRKWLDRELPGLRPLELTWVCCGVDYPHLVAGHADFVLYGHDNPWDHAPGSLILRESGAHLGTLDGRDYDPRRSGTGLVAAADRATYDTVVEAAQTLL